MSATKGISVLQRDGFLGDFTISTSRASQAVWNSISLEWAVGELSALALWKLRVGTFLSLDKWSSAHRVQFLINKTHASLKLSFP